MTTDEERVHIPQIVRFFGVEFYLYLVDSDIEQYTYKVDRDVLIVTKEELSWLMESAAGLAEERNDD